MSGEHQINWDASSSNHEYRCHFSCQSIQQMLRYFTDKGANFNLLVALNQITKLRKLYPLGTMNVCIKCNADSSCSCWDSSLKKGDNLKMLVVLGITELYFLYNLRKQRHKCLLVISLHICGEERSHIYKTHCWISQISKGELDEFFCKQIRWGVNDERGQIEKNKRSMELTLTLSPFVRMSQSVCWNLVRSIWLPPPNNAWGKNQTEYFLNDVWTTS